MVNPQSVNTSLPGFRVLHVLSGDLWGGAEVQMELQIAAQRRLGADARVLLFNSGDVARRFVAAGIPTIELDESGGFHALVRGMLRECDSFHPQIIVSHGYKETIASGLVSLLKSIPLVSTFHGWSESYSGVKRFKMQLYASLYLFVSRYIARERVCVTQALADELQLKARVVHNVGPTTVQKDGAPPFDAGRASIAIVGRLVPVKRVDRAIAAVRALSAHPRHPVLYVIGDGPERAKLEALADESIRFLGFRRDAVSLLQSADLLLITSESEGLPTVLLEAMAAGRPVVATKLPGIQEFVSKFRLYPCRLVRDPRPEAFAAAIEELLREAEPVSEEMLTAIRVYVAPERAAREALEIYTKGAAT